MGSRRRGERSEKSLKDQDSPEQRREGNRSKYEVRINQAQGIVIGDNANVTQNFYNDRAHDSSQQSPLIADLTEHRKNALAHARRFIETKSRALKPIGVLPKLLPLMVSLHVQGPRHRFDNQGTLITDPGTRVSMPLLDAARQSRNTLLLGDMGTGKSTSLGLSIERVCQENEQCLAFIIPARALRLKTSYTLKRLLRAASKYFNEHISPTPTPIDIESLLNSGIDVFIGVDGLDEIPKKEASDLIHQFGAIVMNWSNIQVLITGRPVELLGVSYEDWQVLTTVALDNDEKLRLFEAEAIADGRTESEAKDLAIRLVRKLNSLPNVNVLATSPLVIRLLYPRLLSIQDGRVLTVGDLLFELIRERLRKWAERDAKHIPAPLFEKRYPDEHSRSVLLGRLALKLSGRKAIQVDEARLQLRNLIKSSGESDIDALTDEALHFFEQSGLVLINEEVEFPIQPFFEALCGYGLATLWEESPEAEAGLTLQEWRTVSFAATTGRRLGLADNLRPRLLNFIRELLSGVPNAPAASYIVSESRDSTCAEAFISGLNILGPRPLTLLQSERQQSARTIAESVKLAGEVGFGWMFEHYLDPRYPIINTGSGVIERVFEQWAYLSIDDITASEKKRLASMIMPHMEAGTSQLNSIIPVLAVLIPDEFELKDHLWFCGTLLWDDLFSPHAKRHFKAAYDSGNDTLVNKVLIAHANGRYESAPVAAGLWMDLNAGSRPDPEIVMALIHAYGSPRPNLSVREYIDKSIELIGKQEWLSLLRQYLQATEDNLAAGAVMLIYESGTVDLSLLGEALIKVLHEGGPVRRAETILLSLVHDGGPESLKWLTDRIDSLRHSLLSYPGYWRIFLSELDYIGEKGPQLLASSVEGVDYYLLVRHPEIRNLFISLLNGKHGAEYRNTLRELLRASSPLAQHCAAMILVACDPKNQSEALEIVVRWKPTTSEISRHEWFRFCLSLHFGQSALSHLKSLLPNLDPPAEVFALAILHKNGVKLNKRSYERLVQGLSYWGSYGLDAEDAQLSVVARAESFDALVKAVETGVDEIASGAADKLMEYHSEKLSSFLRAKSACLAIPARFAFGFILLREEMNRMEQDPAYSDAVKEAAIQIVEQGGRRPLLDLVREALTNETAWSDVIWRMLFDNQNLGSFYEDEGQWLLDCGLLAPKYKESIGRAARELLKDPRTRLTYRGEPRQWLAIIADEFVGLPEEEIEEVLLEGGVISETATGSLLARLGRVPTGFQRQNRIGDAPPL
jgi:hypothetical protein